MRISFPFSAVLLFWLFLLGIVASNILFAVEIDFEKESKRHMIYYFVSDYPGFIKANSFDDIPQVEFIPSARQLSVADFAPVGLDVYIAVNGTAPLCFSANILKPAILQALPKKVSDNIKNITSDLTTGTAFSRGESAYFHVYKDLLFSDSDKKKDSVSPILIEIKKKNNSYEVTSHFSDFKEKNPDWQPVELIANERYVLASWKNSNEKKTIFRYIIHDYHGKSIDEVDSGFFRDSYNLKNVLEGGPAVKSFSISLNNDTTGRLPKLDGDIYLRLSSNSLEIYPNGLPAFFFKSNGGGIPVELSACVSKDVLYVLTKKEIIAFDEKMVFCKLPELPKGFSYKKMWTDGLNFIISWEERRFPYTGRSGLIYFEMSDIITE